MRVAVTGADGRLGGALMRALADSPFTGPRGPIGWIMPDYELDDPTSAERLLVRDAPELVVHTAAWTDVDGCARDPDLALRRNGTATGELARACASRGLDLVIISTNEVFDGRRTDGVGYGPNDPPNPINPYGASKLAGEEAARAAYAESRDSNLAIVRTAWLFGPPGADFPLKILGGAARAIASGEALQVVGDEFGTPTYTVDLAEAIADLIGSGQVAGIHHVVNAGIVSRAGWAAELLRQAAVDVELREVPASTWPRASSPPAWAVLRPTPLPSGEPLRPWQAALADYLPVLRRAMAASGGPR